MNKRLTKVVADLQDKKLLKVIAGINNFDTEKVLKIVKASELMGASCVDICADESIIKQAKEISENTALMVSSVSVEELRRAVELGADMIELGNFEALHDQGIFYSGEEVLELARQIMEFKTKILVSITIPGHLSVAEQVELATKLEELGVDILQTEGASLVDTDKASALGQIEKARLTLANTIEISKHVSKSFILTASGLSPDTIKLAISAGASGVGVGKYVNKLESELEMMAAITALKQGLETTSKVATVKI